MAIAPAGTLRPVQVKFAALVEEDGDDADA
jgi:hypothetical protein